MLPHAKLFCCCSSFHSVIVSNHSGRSSYWSSDNDFPCQNHHFITFLLNNSLQKFAAMHEWKHGASVLSLCFKVTAGWYGQFFHDFHTLQVWRIYVCYQTNVCSRHARTNQFNQRYRDVCIGKSEAILPSVLRFFVL